LGRFKKQEKKLLRRQTTFPSAKRISSLAAVDQLSIACFSADETKNNKHLHLTKSEV
jgi:hypothetical protein